MAQERLMNLFKRTVKGYRREIVWALLPFLICFAVALTSSDRFRVSTVLLPALEQTGGGASSLLAQSLGVNLQSLQMTDEQGYPTIFFPDLLKSREVASRVMAGTVTRTGPEGGGEQVPAADHFGVSGIEEFYRALWDLASVTLDLRTGVTSLHIETTDPRLSYSLAVLMIESRIDDVREELDVVQTRLTEWKQANSGWHSTNNPLHLEQLANLQRDVSVKERSYLTLVEQLEIALIRVTQNTPSLQILDRPYLPTAPSGPARMLILFLGVIMSVFTLGAFLLLRGRVQFLLSYLLSALPGSDTSREPAA